MKQKNEEINKDKQNMSDNNNQLFLTAKSKKSLKKKNKKLQQYCNCVIKKIVV